MSAPPSLLDLTTKCVVQNINNITSLNSIPEDIVNDIFVKTLRAGKLNENVLAVFMATGNEQILSFVKAYNIKPIFRPVLPTRCSGRRFYDHRCARR